MSLLQEKLATVYAIALRLPAFERLLLSLLASIADDDGLGAIGDLSAFCLSYGFAPADVGEAVRRLVTALVIVQLPSPAGAFLFRLVLRAPLAHARFKPGRR